MIIYVPPGKRHEYRDELTRYFELRKRIFCDKLNWVEPKPDGLEVDRFDNLFNVYVLSIDDETGELAELMATKGIATESAA